MHRTFYIFFLLILFQLLHKPHFFLIEYLQAIVEDEGFSKFLDNLPTNKLLQDLIEFIDFSNNNIDPLAMLRLLSAFGLPIDV